MQKIVVDCTNLVGDSIYLLKPIEAYLEKYPDDPVAIVADPGLAFEMFRNCFQDKLPVFDRLENAKEAFPDALALKISAGQAADIAYAFSRAPGGRQLHISEAYASILGVTIDNIVPSTKWRTNPLIDADSPGFILLSPFSSSCTYHSTGKRNKTLHDWKWEHIIRYLRKQGLPIKVLGGPNDYLKCTIPVEDYITAKSLAELEAVMLSCKLFVGIDNGLGHVAASLGIPMISIWSKAASIDFIGPVYGRRTAFLLMESPELLAPVALMVGFRKYVKMLLEGTYEKVSAEVRQNQSAS